ncbi:unnamed protein product [Periconia digitata]|uniref:Uncharacterized protein n=1 Tax=Periconia digitata TaxID=1303443 RepID=A0A9W4U1Z3_9PLEO|nr:unnamed protein product [Periconia digitata]
MPRLFDMTATRSALVSQALTSAPLSSNNLAISSSVTPEGPGRRRSSRGRMMELRGS